MSVVGPRGERGGGDAAVLVMISAAPAINATAPVVGLLDARLVQVLQDHGREVLLPVVAGLSLSEMIDQCVNLVDAERSAGRQALHGERAGDADDAPVLVCLVVKVLEVRLGRGLIAAFSSTFPVAWDEVGAEGDQRPLVESASNALFTLGWYDPTGWIANVLPPRAGLLLP